jgi:hypothetical protein
MKKAQFEYSKKVREQNKQNELATLQKKITLEEKKKDHTMRENQTDKVVNKRKHTTMLHRQRIDHHDIVIDILKKKMDSVSLST